MQRAHEPATQAGEIVLETAVVDEYLPAPKEQLCAFLRQPHEAAIPDHQAYGKIFLELLNGGRERGLRDVTSCRGAREVLFARERYEIGQVPNEHGRMTPA
jgi:hypothetical protein